MPSAISSQAPLQPPGRRVDGDLHICRRYNLYCASSSRSRMIGTVEDRPARPRLRPRAGRLIQPWASRAVARREQSPLVLLCRRVEEETFSRWIGAEPHVHFPGPLDHLDLELDSRPESHPRLPYPDLAMAAAMSRRAITHIVFDMDGLLLDTEIYYTKVQEKILARFEKTSDSSLKAKMMGKKAIESAHIFVEENGLHGQLTPEGFLEEREGMLQDMFPGSKLMPGVERLINHFHTKGVPMAVATGSHKRHFALKTQRHGEIFSKMHHVVTSDDPEVKKGKPSPDVFLAAARRFEESVDPSKILVFEDAPTGVAAAKSAGMSVVMVPDQNLDVSYHKDADQVLTSLLDFNPNEWGLPPFDDVASIPTSSSSL